MLAQRQRRWAGIKPTLRERLVFADSQTSCFRLGWERHHLPATNITNLHLFCFFLILSSGKQPGLKQNGAPKDVLWISVVYTLMSLKKWNIDLIVATDKIQCHVLKDILCSTVIFHLVLMCSIVPYIVCFMFFYCVLLFYTLCVLFIFNVLYFPVHYVFTLF